MRASMIAVLGLSCLLGLYIWPADAHDFNKESRTAVRRQEAATEDRIATLPDQLRPHVRSIIRRDAIWSRRTTSVCFGPAAHVDSRSALINQIMAIADEWTDGIEFKFDWGSPNVRVCRNVGSADIRVYIAPPDRNREPIFTSLLGNEAMGASLDNLSGYSLALMFPSQSAYYDRDEVRRFYVLHEFGHALGFDHEHQRVDCEYDWAYIANTFHFASPNEARDNMGKKFSTKIKAFPSHAAVVDGQVILTAYDNYSIMKYNLSTSSVPTGDDPRVYKGCTQSACDNPCYRSGWVSKLTAFDKAGMAKAYQNPDAVVAALSINLAEVPTDARTDQNAQNRLTDATLGRASPVPIGTQRRALAGNNPDPDLDWAQIKNNAQAVKVIKQILAERFLRTRSAGR